MFGERSVIMRGLGRAAMCVMTASAVLASAGCGSNENGGITQIVQPTSVLLLGGGNLTVGQSTKLLATPYGAYGQLDLPITWKSSATTIATVDAVGNVLGVSAGKVTITATATGGGKSASNSVEMTIVAAASAQ